ncbi:MAG: hypothetical protein HZB38_15770 [Planctomycetes bacterium]|nr:hypothetical protein [Planctomycetota bacterium]
MFVDGVRSNAPALYVGLGPGKMRKRTEISVPDEQAEQGVRLLEKWDAYARFRVRQVARRFRKRAAISIAVGVLVSLVFSWTTGRPWASYFSYGLPIGVLAAVLTLLVLGWLPGKREPEPDWGPRCPECGLWLESPVLMSVVDSVTRPEPDHVSGTDESPGSPPDR